MKCFDMSLDINQLVPSHQKVVAQHSHNIGNVKSLVTKWLIGGGTMSTFGRG